MVIWALVYSKNKLGLAIMSLTLSSVIFLGASPSQKNTAATGYPRLQSIYIKMRDGVRLAADLWLPTTLSKSQKIPTIMRCTRYWRAQDIVGGALENDSNYEKAKVFNENGYAFLMVDIRGTGASFGNKAVVISEEDIKDLGEIVDWVVAQPWSNRKVGAYGVSYSGNTAEMLLINKRSAVSAVAPLFNDFNSIDHLAYPGGVFLSFFADMWGRYIAALDSNDICGAEGVSGIDCQQLTKKIRGVKPVDEDKDRKLLAEAIAQHRTNAEIHEAARQWEFHDDPFGPERIQNVYSMSNPSGYVKEIETSGSALFVRVGWLDAATVNGALGRFLTIDNPQKLIIGAWSHGGAYDTDPFLQLDQPPKPNLEKQNMEMIDFFDDYLKTGAPPITKSSITYYTMGAGTWSTTEGWPPLGFPHIDWYFDSGRKLVQNLPQLQSGSDKYTVNYEATTGQTNRWYTNMTDGDVVYPDRAEEDKKLLSYTSDPLGQDATITGHPIITLYVTSTAEDGAFFVYLEDVDESGKVRYITEGQLRAICRKTSSHEPPYKIFGPYRTFKRIDILPLVPNQVAELTFDLWATSVLIKKGHRIRIAVAGADKDNFARYPRNGTVPIISIERNKKFPSKIMLPMKNL